MEKINSLLSISGKLLNIFPALLIFILFIPAYGQTTSLTVTVSDASGARIPGALVTITGQNTNQTIEQTTDAIGEARFTNLMPGTYNIRVKARSFATMTVPDVKVSVSQAKTVDLTLGAGSQANISLPVTGTGVEEAQGEEISSLPNLNNDLTPLLQVVPGAVATGPSALGRVIIDGKGKEQQTVRLDGADFTVMADLPSTDPAIDALGSFQKPEVANNFDKSGTKSGAFSPISGPGTGSVSESVTYAAAPGSPLWKAQVYGEHRNDALNARNYFDFDGKNALRRSRFGGKVGGPLDHRMDKLLYFAYDGIRGRIERNIYEAVPSDVACNCAQGPLAPLMSSYLPPGTQIVPGASLNPDFLVARRRTHTSVASNAWDVRFDYYPLLGAREKDTGRDAPHAGDIFTFRFTRQTAENLVPDGITGRIQQQRLVFNNALFGLKLVNATKVGPDGSAKEFGHNFRFGFNQTRAHVGVQVLSPADRDLSQSLLTIGGSVKTTGLPVQVIPEQVPTIPVATLGGLIKGTGRGLDLRPVSYSAIYDYSRPIKANHELYAGFEARFIHLDFDRLGGLTYAFPDTTALRAGTPGSVTFLSDLSGQSPFSSSTGRRRASQEYYMGYFQMVSQFRKAGDPGLLGSVPALTLTYGFRYDYFSPVRARDNRAVVANPRTGEILPPGTPFYRTEKLNIQPRFGLAYRLAESGLLKNTILRAGVGLYSGVPRISDLMLPIESDRFSTGINGGTFPTDQAEVIRGFVASPETRQFQPLAFARDFTTPERALKWEAMLTHTLYGYDLALLYAGNIGRNLPLAGLANRIVSVLTNPDPTKAAIVIRELDIVRGNQVFKPFGEFFYRTSGGHSSYNAMTILLKRNTKADEKPINPWLREAVRNLTVQYTLKRNVGNASGTLVSDPFNFDADFGDNLADARHNFSISAVYDLWSAHSRRSTNLLWGWKIMPTLKVSSGLPIVVRLDRPDVVYLDASGNVFSAPAEGRRAVINTPGGGATGSARVPDLIPGVSPFTRNGVELLNPAAFAIPAPGMLGNLRRGQLRGPGFVQLDLGVRRNLFAKEHMSGEFQVDIFNVFNHANFNNPTAALPGLLGTSAVDNQLQPGVPFARASAGSFGIITAAEQGRLIQFSLNLRFNEGFTK